MISLHISKAFDRVWHNGLLAILHMFDLHHALIKWIASFVPDRSITSRAHGFLSEPHSVNSGVLQGSVILPVLIILFIKDLLSSTSTNIYSFADDACLSSSFHLFHNTFLTPVFHLIITPQLHFSPLTCQLQKSGIMTTLLSSIKKRRNRLLFQLFLLFLVSSVRKRLKS